MTTHILCLQIMNTIRIMVQRLIMLIMQCIHTTKATMKRWEYHRPKSKAMVKGKTRLVFMPFDCFVIFVS